ncbi:hypothetical protein FGB62_1g651 [Gracilaria domingensis]|nr:hypothetical protein FGB62_1g651 [Gracilaria domingensis]
MVRGRARRWRLAAGGGLLRARRARRSLARHTHRREIKGATREFLRAERVSSAARAVNRRALSARALFDSKRAAAARLSRASRRRAVAPSRRLAVSRLLSVSSRSASSAARMRVRAAGFVRSACVRGALLGSTRGALLAGGGAVCRGRGADVREARSARAAVAMRYAFAAGACALLLWLAVAPAGSLLPRAAAPKRCARFRTHDGALIESD